MRPERRLSGRKAGRRKPPTKRQPFWRISGKSQGFGDGVPKQNNALRRCRIYDRLIAAAFGKIVERMHCSFYLRKGTAFVPTMARTEAGYWMGVEPVEVQKVETVEALEQLLLAVIARGNPVVPTPTRQNFPRPVMERHCGLKSLSAFERTATCWSISGNEVAYRIYEWRRSERYRGAREEATDSEVRLPADTLLKDVARRAAEVALAQSISVLSQ
jgi:hypothetical protein